MTTNSMRKLLGSCLLIVLIAMLFACDGGLFLTSQQQKPAALIVQAPRASGGAWEVLIAVSGITDDLTGIVIEDGGLITNDIDVTTIVATGMNGFLVTAQDFNDSPLHGRLMAVTPLEGLSDGKILRLTFQASGPSPSLTLDKSKLALSSEQGVLIDSWGLETTGGGE